LLSEGDELIELAVLADGGGEVLAEVGEKLAVGLRWIHLSRVDAAQETDEFMLGRVPDNTVLKVTKRLHVGRVLGPQSGGTLQFGDLFVESRQRKPSRRGAAAAGPRRGRPRNQRADVA